MSVLQIVTVLAPLAFIVGFALQRGNVCSVLAARQIAWMGRWSRLRGLLLASLWAFAVLMPLAWYAGAPFAMSGGFPLSILPLIGGVLYAFGCYVNGACIFGVCSRLTAGDLAFLFAIPAMAGGATIAELTHAGPAPGTQTPTLAALPSGPLISLWFVAAGVLIVAMARMIRGHRRAGMTPKAILWQSRWRPALAATLLGLIGGVLFALDVAWIYPALFKRLGFYMAGLAPHFPLDTVVGSAALFLGGIAAAGYHGRFALRRPHLLRSLQSIVGGTIMGFAWALVPGGNDAMVLWLVPSLAFHGIIAYAAMLGTLIGLETLKRNGRLPA